MFNFSRIYFAYLLVAILPCAIAAGAESSVHRVHVCVGASDPAHPVPDARGLQAVIDDTAAKGGGEVHIGPGRYLLRSPLTLRSSVDISGEPGKTVLVVCDSITSPLACDGDCNERQITLQTPGGFEVGDGVLIRDARYSGFSVTTARLTRKVDERTFAIDMPLYLDYMMANKAAATLVFPAIGGWNVHDVAVSGITVEGNREKTDRTDGCRSGGIYLFESQRITISNCTVRNYNGDGISFQVSDDVTVEDCLTENNIGIGFHPGSGSQRPRVLRNRSTGDGRDGIFVCWRVRGGIFEKNILSQNAGAGISIGHKDSDNLFRENTIISNAKAGLLFRNETEPMGAHRNIFEKNQILDNNRADGKDAAQIVIRGHHHNLVFRDNTIGNTAAGSPATVGISPGQFAQGLVSEGNRFPNIPHEIHEEQ